MRIVLKLTAYFLFLRRRLNSPKRAECPFVFRIECHWAFSFGKSKVKMLSEIEIFKILSNKFSLLYCVNFRNKCILEYFLNCRYRCILEIIFPVKK